MHNDGMTPPGAPHGCLLGSPPGIGHVCTVAIPIPELDPERFDVMYPYAGVPLAEKQLDIGHDDYFRHPWPIEDFADSPFLRPVADRPAVPQSGDAAVTLEASDTEVRPGTRVTLSGGVAGACAGADVNIEERPPGRDSFTPVSNTSTARDGTYEVVVRIRRTRVFRAVVPASGGCTGGESPEVEVRAARG